MPRIKTPRRAAFVRGSVEYSYKIIVAFNHPFVNLAGKCANLKKPFFYRARKHGIL